MITYMLCLDYDTSVDSMETDKVNGLSIKLQFNGEEAWAEAVAAMLENLSCFLQWVSVQSGPN
jgi:hypothetical protein